jgi:hypothetical protein
VNNLNNYREPISEFEQKQKELAIKTFLKRDLSIDKKYSYCSEDFVVFAKFENGQWQFTYMKR